MFLFGLILLPVFWNYWWKQFGIIHSDQRQDLQANKVSLTPALKGSILSKSSWREVFWLIFCHISLQVLNSFRIRFLIGITNAMRLYLKPMSLQVLQFNEFVNFPKFCMNIMASILNSIICLLDSTPTADIFYKKRKNTFPNFMSCN